MFHDSYLLNPVLKVMFNHFLCQTNWTQFTIMPFPYNTMFEPALTQENSSHMYHANLASAQMLPALLLTLEASVQILPI